MGGPPQIIMTGGEGCMEHSGLFFNYYIVFNYLCTSERHAAYGRNQDSDILKRRCLNESNQGNNGSIYFISHYLSDNRKIVLATMEL